MGNSAKLRAIGYTILYALCMLVVIQFFNFRIDGEIGNVFFFSFGLWLVLMAGCLILQLFVSEEGSWL